MQETSAEVNDIMCSLPSMSLGVTEARLQRRSLTLGDLGGPAHGALPHTEEPPGMRGSKDPDKWCDPLS